MKKILSILLSIVFIVSAFTSCSVDTNKKELLTTNDIITNLYPANCEVSIHTDKQVKYLESDYDKLPLGVKGKKNKATRMLLHLNGIMLQKKAKKLNIFLLLVKIKICQIQ